LEVVVDEEDGMGVCDERDDDGDGMARSEMLTVAID
jgi:hypothetical protein